MQMQKKLEKVNYQFSLVSFHFKLLILMVS
jgi:hypothetical protein